MAERDSESQGEHRLLLGRPDRANAMRISPARYSAGNCPRPRSDVVAAIADGIGSTKGGRVAARDRGARLPRRLLRFARDHGGAPRRGQSGQFAQQLDSFARPAGPKSGADGLHLHPHWFLRGRIAHLLHVGDTRAYRFSGDRLTLLTTDHARQSGAGRPRRALPRARASRRRRGSTIRPQPLARHDRFLLCSDGVHGVLARPSASPT